MSFNHYYQSELTALRQLGKRFAERSPALAPFLGQSGRDPDVERLLEGFAFLTGRLRQKLDDELPELTHSLMHLLWPNYMRPLPAFSMLHLAQYQRQVQVASLRSDHDPLSLNFAIEGRREVDDLHRQVSFAAHQDVPTACPVPDHGSNPTAAGSTAYQRTALNMLRYTVPFLSLLMLAITFHAPGSYWPVDLQLLGYSLQGNAFGWLSSVCLVAFVPLLGISLVMLIRYGSRFIRARNASTFWALLLFALLPLCALTRFNSWVFSEIF